MKIAIVHDYLAQFGGAERVALAMHQLWPDAPIYTSVYDPTAFRGAFNGAEIRTSGLQKLFGRARYHKLALPFYGTVFEQFDLSTFEVVLSTSSGFAKGVITAPETCHICYCHTPNRLAWRYHEYIGHKGGFMTKLLVRPLLNNLRSWDYTSAQRVDQFLANSHNTAKRIRKYYGRESLILHAPVESSRFRVSQRTNEDSFYLVVSRLLNYKRVDLAVDACTRLGRTLVIVGGGPDEKQLKKRAGPTVTFAGKVSDQEVADLFSNCEALIFPGEEDFGITPLEAMASGRPVIAYAKGGALETVVEGTTGVFFHEASADSLVNAIESYESNRHLFSPEALQSYARKFDVVQFKSKLKERIAEAVAQHKAIYS